MAVSQLWISQSPSGQYLNNNQPALNLTRVEHFFPCIHENSKVSSNSLVPFFLFNSQLKHQYLLFARLKLCNLLKTQESYYYLTWKRLCGTHRLHISGNRFREFAAWFSQFQTASISNSRSHDDFCKWTCHVFSRILHQDHFHCMQIRDHGDLSSMARQRSRSAPPTI